MHCSFDSGDLSILQLKISSRVYYVLPGNEKDSLSNYSSRSVSNTKGRTHKLLSRAISLLARGVG